MNLVLGNPALLPFLGLAAVPLLVHLFATARPKVYPFSSVKLLEEVVRKTARLQRPQHWLILILRTLLVLAFLLAFLKPVLMRQNPLSSRSERKSVVVLVDASASMRAAEGPRSRFASATARASEIIDGLGSADVANIIWVRRQPLPVYPVLGPNKGPLKEALKQGEASLENGNFSAAAGKAIDFLRKAEGKKELQIVSDFQAENWKEPLPKIPDDVRVVMIRVGKDRLSNQALVKVQAESASALAGEEVALDCEVMNYSDEHALRTVFLRAGEFSDSREIRLPPWSSGGVSFNLRPGKAGNLMIQASLDEDKFPADNMRYTVVDVLRSLKVAVWSPAGRVAPWTRALGSLSWVEIVPFSRADLAGADFVILDSWNGENKEELKEYLESGGSLLLAAGDELDPAEAAWLLGTEGKPSERIWKKNRSSEAMPLQMGKAEHPVFGIFQSGLFGDPARGALEGRLEVPPASLSLREELLRYRDGSPALAVLQGEKGRGNLLWWNLPVSPKSGGYAARSEFVPLLGELLLHYRRSPESERRVFLAGERVSLDFGREVLDEDVELWSGDRLIPVERQEGQVFVSRNPLGPGTYTWKYQELVAGESVVNFPETESDLRLMPQEEEAKVADTAVAAGASIRELREGTELWPWLIAAALLFALAEGTTVWRTRPAE